MDGPRSRERKRVGRIGFVWRMCPVCRAIAAAHAQGPPGVAKDDREGWTLGMEHIPEEG